jgi:hypothetical protein
VWTVDALLQEETTHAVLQALIINHKQNITQQQSVSMLPSIFIYREQHFSNPNTHFGLTENGERLSISSPPEHSTGIEDSTHDIYLESSLLEVSNDIGVCGIL